MQDACSRSRIPSCNGDEIDNSAIQRGISTYLSFQSRQVQNKTDKEDGCQGKEDHTEGSDLVVLVSIRHLLYLIEEEDGGGES